MRRTILFASAVAALALGIACGERASRVAEPTAPSLALSDPDRLLSMSPASATIPIRGTVWINASAPPPAVARRIQWWTSDRAVATVNQNGVVTGLAAGTATVFAASGSRRGSAEITVGDPPAPPGSGDVVLLALGDIARCSSSGDEATGVLVDGIPGTIATLGDNVYFRGTTAEFAECFEPSWGRHKSRIRPAPGNHEYETPGAAGYYAYFGAAAGDPDKGYYSYDLGDWHIIALNSSDNCRLIGCAAGSAQEQWLRADLAANARPCTLAYWHHPRFNSGSDHGNSPRTGPLWNALYDGGADIVLNGHEHVYERFAPQTPAAVADPARGIRQFTVGTGGGSHDVFGSTLQPNSEARSSDTYGVLKLTLKANGYDWEFVPVAGKTFTDSGSGACH